MTDLLSLSAFFRYALRLSEYHNYGRCGIGEKADDEKTLLSKISELVTLVLEASYCVVHTGAGISTAAGIPDFRGKGGVWTRHKQVGAGWGRLGLSAYDLVAADLAVP